MFKWIDHGTGKIIVPWKNMLAPQKNKARRDRVELKMASQVA